MSSFLKTLLPICVLGAAVLAGACTNDTLDDGASADVVLEVEALQNPAVSATLDQQSGSCAFTVTDWQFNAANLPKNALAESSPFNDIQLVSVTIEYNWLDPTISTPTRVFGLGNTIVPVGGNSLVAFQPIAFDDLSLALQSRTANLTMTFLGRTVEGTNILTVLSRQLSVEVCI